MSRSGGHKCPAMVAPSSQILGGPIEVWWPQVSILGGHKCLGLVAPLESSGPKCQSQVSRSGVPKLPALGDPIEVWWPQMSVLGGHKCPGLVSPSSQLLVAPLKSGDPKCPAPWWPQVSRSGGPIGVWWPQKSILGVHKCPDQAAPRSLFSMSPLKSGGPQLLVTPLKSGGPKCQSLVAISVRVWWPQAPSSWWPH